MDGDGRRGERLGIALVGCGYWGIKLCRVLAQHAAVDLRWVIDAESTNLARGLALAPLARGAEDIAEALDDPAVRAVVVAVPVQGHHRVTLRALRAGRDVLVEKPLAASVEEAQELCLAAAQEQAILMVGHVFLYNQAVRRVKAMIDAGDLGDIRYAFSRRLNLGIVRPDVDVMWDLGSHDVSILDYWIDRPITEVAAVSNSFLRPGVADVAFAHLTYEGNIAGHVQVSWLDPAKVRQVTVVGSRKMLVYDDIATDARIAVHDCGIDLDSPLANVGGFASFAQHQVTLRAGDTWLPKVAFEEPLVLEVSEFAASCASRDAPLSDGARGLRIVETLAAISTAMRVGSTRLIGSSPRPPASR